MKRRAKGRRGFGRRRRTALHTVLSRFFQYPVVSRWSADKEIHTVVSRPWSPKFRGFRDVRGFSAVLGAPRRDSRIAAHCVLVALDANTRPWRLQKPRFGTLVLAGCGARARVFPGSFAATEPGISIVASRFTVFTEQLQLISNPRKNLESTVPFTLFASPRAARAQSRRTLVLALLVSHPAAAFDTAPQHGLGEEAEQAGPT